MNSPSQRITIIKREGIMLFLGLLAQWPIWWASVLAARGCRSHWSELSGDADPMVPVLTQLSMIFLPLIAPMIIVALLVVFVLGCTCRSSAMILRGLFLTMMVEACFLGLFALGVILPGLSITLNMSR